MTGLVVAAILNLCLWGGSALVASRFFQPAKVLERVFAAAVIGFVAIVVLLEGLSLVGMMHFGPVAAFSGAAALAGTALWWSAGQRARLRTPAVAAVTGTAPRGQLQGVLAGTAATIAVLLSVLTAVYFLARGLVLPVETVSDAPIYHLYFAVQWWKAARIHLVPTPFGELAASYFPANGDVWLTWLVLGTGNELLAKVGQWPFLLLGATAVYALGRQTGAGAAAAAFPAALWATLPAVVAFSGVANVDLIFAAWYLIAVYFFVRFVRRRNERRVATASLALFALSAGAALGTKSVGLSLVAMVAAPAVPIALAGERRWRDTAILVAGLLVPAAYWYGRNLWWTGNPVYPLHVEWFGKTILAGWYDTAAMRTSGYHLRSADLGAFVDRLTAVLDLRVVWLLAAGIVAGPALSLFTRHRAGRNWTAAALAALAAAQLAVYWFLIPYNTQERFLLPAFALALVPLAPVLERRAWLQVPLVALLAWHVLTPQWSTAFSLPPQTRGAVLLPIRGNLLLEQAPWRAMRRDPLLRFYPGWDFGRVLLPAWRALERASAQAGKRIAYAGTNLPYYLFGRGLRNDVFYVNVNAHPGWKPHDYHLARIRAGQREPADHPWPQWYREGPGYQTWLDNLRRRRIELLFVARENRHGRREALPGPPPFPIEYAWAEQHPEVFQRLGPPASPGQPEPWACVYRLKTPEP